MVYIHRTPHVEHEAGRTASLRPVPACGLQAGVAVVDVRTAPSSRRNPHVARDQIAH
ncbi:hypothetical protein [Kibdelosporangium aridum]|uniref:hypothetical protein n=1 Tax=Kibdelosporangium aridum TaxID=2030 RepID=UPI000A7D68E8|nr:hypothetical protein [Kibdelosporangium aridum]